METFAEASDISLCNQTFVTNVQFQKTSQQYLRLICQNQRSQCELKYLPSDSSEAWLFEWLLELLDVVGH